MLYTARVRCTVLKDLIIEANSLAEARAKAQEWDCLDESEVDCLESEVQNIRQEKG